MPILLTTEVPNFWLNEPLRVYMVAGGACEWPKCKLNVVTPDNIIVLNTHADVAALDGTSLHFYTLPKQYKHVNMLTGKTDGRYDCKMYADWTTALHDKWMILEQHRGLQQHLHDETIVTYYQPVMWVRSDNVAELLGGTGPGVHMEPEILADWLGDHTENKADRLIESRLRKLIAKGDKK